MAGKYFRAIEKNQSPVGIEHRWYVVVDKNADFENVVNPNINFEKLVNIFHSDQLL